MNIWLKKEHGRGGTKWDKGISTPKKALKQTQTALNSQKIKKLPAKNQNLMLLTLK